MDRINYWYLVLVLCFQNVLASDLSDTVNVKRLYVETEKRVLVNYDYNMVDRQAAQYDLNLGLDLELPATFYYNNKVVSTTDRYQFRFVGLEFEVGAQPIEGVDLYFQHFSGHALDSHFDEYFPQQNKIGIRFNLISN